MNKRPLSITIIGWLFIVTGAVGLLYHAKELKVQQPFPREIIWITLVRILAIIGGAFLLAGHDWARWLLLAWLAFHVVLSAFHSLFEVVMHALLFVAIALFLFRPKAAAFFGHIPWPDSSTRSGPGG